MNNGSLWMNAACCASILMLLALSTTLAKTTTHRRNTRGAMPMLVRVSPWLIARFFNKIAHGDAEHRAWLLAEIEAFWGWKLDRGDVADGLMPKPEEAASEG